MVLIHRLCSRLLARSNNRVRLRSHMGRLHNSGKFIPVHAGYRECSRPEFVYFDLDYTLWHAAVRQPQVESFLVPLLGF